MKEIFILKNNVWVVYMYGCQHCTDTFKTIKYCARHEEQCKVINTIKKAKEEDETNMLVQRVTKGDQSFYRSGSNGKLYKTKQEAESGGKIKGADGKACWDGYRYAGTKNGKDNCVKVKGK